MEVIPMHVASQFFDSFGAIEFEYHGVRIVRFIEFADSKGRPLGVICGYPGCTKIFHNQQTQKARRTGSGHSKDIRYTGTKALRSHWDVLKLYEPQHAPFLSEEMDPVKTKKKSNYWNIVWSKNEWKEHMFPNNAAHSGHRLTDQDDNHTVLRKLDWGYGIIRLPSNRYLVGNAGNMHQVGFQKTGPVLACGYPECRVEFPSFVEYKWNKTKYAPEGSANQATKQLLDHWKNHKDHEPRNDALDQNRFWRTITNTQMASSDYIKHLQLLPMNKPPDNTDPEDFKLVQSTLSDWNQLERPDWNLTVNSDKILIEQKLQESRRREVTQPPRRASANQHTVPQAQHFLGTLYKPTQPIQSIPQHQPLHLHDQYNGLQESIAQPGFFPNLPTGMHAPNGYQFHAFDPFNSIVHGTNAGFQPEMHVQSHGNIFGTALHLIPNNMQPMHGGTIDQHAFGSDPNGHPISFPPVPTQYNGALMDQGFISTSGQHNPFLPHSRESTGSMPRLEPSTFLGADELALSPHVSPPQDNLHTPNLLNSFMLPHLPNEHPRIALPTDFDGLHSVYEPSFHVAWNAAFSEQEPDQYYSPLPPHEQLPSQSNVSPKSHTYDRKQNSAYDPTTRRKKKRALRAKLPAGVAGTAVG